MLDFKDGSRLLDIKDESRLLDFKVWQEISYRTLRLFGLIFNSVLPYEITRTSEARQEESFSAKMKKLDEEQSLP